jgi:hypothetical protein
VSSRAISYPAGFQLTDKQRAAQAQVYFETHRARQLALYYPPDSVRNLSESSRVGCWTDPPLVLTKVEAAFEFGETLYQAAFDDLTSDLQYFVDIAQEQLLYWHLADTATVTNHPTDHLVLWSKSDYLWFYHVPPRREEYILQLRHGNHIYYVDQVRISYEEIQIKFCEIRLIEGIITLPRLVITGGREYLYSWTTQSWQTNLANSEQTVNPRVYQEPPEEPDDPELIELLEARTDPQATQALPSLLARIQADNLPASSPSTPSPSPPSSDGWGHSINRCWCNNELCTCGYRPDTPPTPPSVVLWKPGQQHLPFRE